MRVLSSVGEKIDAHSFPATTEELIEEYGELELDLPNGTETFGEAMGRLESETFEDAAAVRQAAYSAVGSGAIGRKGYSDRDPVAPGEDGPRQLSF